MPPIFLAKKLAFEEVLWLNAQSMAERFPKEETAKQRTYRAFEAMVIRDDATIDLAQAALLIASTAYPDLDMAHYLEQLDTLARRVRVLLTLPMQETQPELPENINLLQVLRALNQVLFIEEQFYGNEADYSNPENSFFNRVLEKHTGIPITLSLLYMEIGRRVGIQIDGIGLPYHFMVRCCLPERILYIDPFEGGLFFSEKECRERVRNRAEHRGKFKLHAQWFAPITRKQLLFRMLNNLKHIYLQDEDYEHALTICDLMILLMPQSASERRDRGTIHLQLKHYARALHDLMVYLELAPSAKDRLEIQKQIEAIRQIMSMLN